MEEQLTAQQAADMIRGMRAEPPVYFAEASMAHDGDEIVVTIASHEEMQEKNFLHRLENEGVEDFDFSESKSHLTISRIIYWLEVNEGVKSSRLKVRLGGKKIVPKDHDEEQRYSGPYREPITEVPLTRELLQKILSEIRADADEYWRNRKEERTVSLGLGLLVTMNFSPSVPLDERDEMVRDLEKKYLTSPLSRTVHHMDVYYKPSLCCNTRFRVLPETDESTENPEDVTCDGTPPPFYFLPDGSDVRSHVVGSSDDPASPLQEVVTLGEFSKFLQFGYGKIVHGTGIIPIFNNHNRKINDGHVVLTFERYNDHSSGSTIHDLSWVSGGYNPDAPEASLPLHVRMGEETVPLNRDLMYRILYQICLWAWIKREREDGRSLDRMISFQRDFRRFVYRMRAEDLYFGGR